MHKLHLPRDLKKISYIQHKFCVEYMNQEQTIKAARTTLVRARSCKLVNEDLSAKSSLKSMYTASIAMHDSESAISISL